MALPGAESMAQALRAAAEHPDPLTLGLVVLLIALLPMTMVVPMTAVCIAAAAVLPTWLGVPVILGGIMLNTALAWGLARTVFGARMERWLEARGGRLGAIRDGARRNGLKWAILCRYLPAPFIASPMVLATTGVGLGVTVLGSAIGMAPWTGAYVWVAHAGREGSLRSLSLAGGGLALLYLAAGLLRRKALEPAPAARLEPRDPALPVVTLYSLPGQELSDEAREELAGLRERLGFEVLEVPLDASADPALAARHQDHAPVAFFDGHKLFNFKMDENVLAVRLKEWRGRQGAK